MKLEGMKKKMETYCTCGVRRKCMRHADWRETRRRRGGQRVRSVRSRASPMGFNRTALVHILRDVALELRPRNRLLLLEMARTSTARSLAAAAAALCAGVAQSWNNGAALTPPMG